MQQTRWQVLTACAQPGNVRLGARTRQLIYMTAEDGVTHEVTETVKNLREAGLVMQRGDGFTVARPDRADYGLTA